MELEFRCEAGRYPADSLRATLACETGGTWGPQHFLNPVLVYLVFQNVPLAFLVPGINEIMETIWRTQTPKEKHGDNDIALGDYESPLGSLVYDWLIQGSSVLTVGVPLVQVLGLQTQERRLWTCRLLWTFALLLLTLLLELLSARIDEHAGTGLHVLSFILVGLSNVAGFAAIAIANAYSDMTCKGFLCCDPKGAARGCCLPMPSETYRKIGIATAVYAVIVAVVLTAGSGTGSHLQTAYIWLLSFETAIIGILWIWWGVVLWENPQQFRQLLSREGCL